MSYSQAFLTRLNTGECLVRRIFPNPNKPGQMSVQFIQQVERPVEVANDLVGIAQGLGDIGTTRVTAIFSFAASVLQGLGISAGDYHTGNQVLAASQLFGKTVNISVVENTQIDTKRPNMQPKINPETGLVVEKNGMPVYRHTKLTSGTPVLEFVTDVDKVPAPAGQAASAAIEPF
jgi:hypothetical protein